MKNIVQFTFSVCLSVLLFSDEFCGAAPPIAQYLSETEQLRDPDSAAQDLMVEQELRRQFLRNWAQEAETENGSYDMGDINRTGFGRLRSQKRGDAAALQKQTRTGRGGVALCLWKVCPAGPWLVAKKK